MSTKNVKLSAKDLFKGRIVYTVDVLGNIHKGTVDTRKPFTYESYTIKALPLDADELTRRIEDEGFIIISADTIPKETIGNWEQLQEWDKTHSEEKTVLFRINRTTIFGHPIKLDNGTTINFMGKNGGFLWAFKTQAHAEKLAKTITPKQSSKSKLRGMRKFKFRSALTSNI